MPIPRRWTEASKGNEVARDSCSPTTNEIERFGGASRDNLWRNHAIARPMRCEARRKKRNWRLRWSDVNVEHG